jgi:hypothetical protein
MGVNSTPTIYINGRAVIGALPWEGVQVDHRRRSSPGSSLSKNQLEISLNRAVI